MTITLFAMVAAAPAVAGIVWLRRTPACPRCRARKYDRYACKPLLLCLRCATRVDSSGRTYN
jgi:hypothetical protein